MISWREEPFFGKLLRRTVQYGGCMKLLFKQRLLSLLDNYDVYNENGNTIYTVESQLALGHCLKIYDARGNELGTVKQRILSFLPRFEMYQGDIYLGCIKKELSLFKPRFTIDCDGWQMSGDWLEWDYRILDRGGQELASVYKEIWNWADTYVIDVANPSHALRVLMLVLAIDAEKCSRSN